MDAHTIVVGYDGSPDAKVALEEAITHVREDGIVHVVTVHNPKLTSYNTEMLPDEFRQSVDPEAADRMRLHDAELRLRSAGVRFESHLMCGRPAPEILELAAKVDADLIVLGSRGLGSVQRLVLGSVSTRVAAHAHTSTLIVHDEAVAAA